MVVFVVPRVVGTLSYSEFSTMNMWGKNFLSLTLGMFGICVNIRKIAIRCLIRHFTFFNYLHFSSIFQICKV